MEKQKLISSSSGYWAMFICIIIILSPIANAFTEISIGILVGTIILSFLGIIGLIGLMIIDPNEARVMILFGKYSGTVKTNGFFWVNPFYIKKKLSLRARNFDSEPLKVNDKLGNPINISVILVWKVENTYKAAFEVDNYENFVRVQTEAAVRKLALSYPYDNFEHEDELTLRTGGEEINHMLEEEIRERLEIAGIHVLEARISNLAYASEIAAAMLQRQQATAVVAARTKIVEGAVGMVEMALQMLSEKNIIELDDDKKAAMVSNLMVVLTSDKAAAPVINTGTLHH